MRRARRGTARLAAAVVGPKGFGKANGLEECPIVIERGMFFARTVESIFLEALVGREPTSFVVVSDSNVIRLYARKVTKILAGIAKTNLVRIPAGERSKSWDRCERILANFAKFDLDRDGVVVALGGGVVGDLGGFAASIYKRGVKYVQVPTTLLAQVDSSIGGKTGVDTSWGKNQIGTFYHPTAVLIDPQFLETLPPPEILNGVGEMVKYGVIASEEVFSKLEGLANFEAGDLAELIEPCCRIKAEIVSMDERDESIRSVLNYGHTVAHAIEASSSYKTGHGVSVLLGMLCEGWISRELGILEHSDYERQSALIARLVPKRASRLLNHEGAIARFAMADKKNSGGQLKMTLPERIGKMRKTNGYKILVPMDLLKASLKYAKTMLASQ
jgi:3-dehydroquinate synthase